MCRRLAYISCCTDSSGEWWPTGPRGAGSGVTSRVGILSLMAGSRQERWRGQRGCWAAHCNERPVQRERVRPDAAPFRWFLALGSVPEAQAVDVGGHQVDALLADVGGLGRHVAVAAVAQGLAHGVRHALARCLVEPDVVGQVGRPQCLVAGAVGHMAGGTHRGEGRRTRFGTLLVVLEAGERQHVLGDVLDVGLTQLLPGGHQAVTTAVQGGEDLLGLATVEPVVVGQVGEAVAALGVGADLTDDDWLYSGEPEQILTTLNRGRNGQMPSWQQLGETNIENVTQHVLALSGLEHDEERAEAGAATFASVCAACHMPDGTGNQALGPPNLTNDIA